MRMYGRNRSFAFSLLFLLIPIAFFRGSPAQAYAHDILYVINHDMPESCQNRLMGDECQTAMNECLAKFSDDPSDFKSTNAMIAACIRDRVNSTGRSHRRSSASDEMSDGDAKDLADRCQKEKLEQAIAACTALLQSQSGEDASLIGYSFRAAAHFEKGEATGDRANYRAAIADYTEAIRFATTDAMRAGVLTGRAKAYFRNAQYEPAISDATQVIGTTSDRILLAGAYASRGSALCSEGFERVEHANGSDNIGTDGTWNRVVDDINKALALSSDVPASSKTWLLTCLASGHEMTKNFAAAIADFGTLYAMNPRSPRYLRSRGLAKRFLGTERHSPTLIADGEKDIAAATRIDPSLR